MHFNILSNNNYYGVIWTVEQSSYPTTTFTIESEYGYDAGFAIDSLPLRYQIFKSNAAMNVYHSW